MTNTPGITIERLENGDIEAGTFGHVDHVYVAWLYLDHYTVPEAIERFSAALRRLTLKLGVPGKYHETITWFYMLAIAERRNSTPGADWDEFRQANQDLFARDDNLLYRYYSKTLLESDEARTRFVLPDRIAA